MANKSLDKRQYGDFQTPDDFAVELVELLRSRHNICPDIVIEPTCGKGAFVRAALRIFPYANVIAYDVNPSYVQDAKDKIPVAHADRTSINQGDFFLLDWKSILKDSHGNLLILGNPPWVTSSELGILNSRNLPKKTNFQGRRGIEAITGSGNFDISEWMLLRHVDWLSSRDGALAMLCKYSVARKIMRRIRQNKAHRLFGHIYSIDAMKYFSAAVDACLFVLTTEEGNTDCEVYSDLSSSKPKYVIGERDGYVVKNVELYEEYKRISGRELNYVWRSGIKHDCAKVMELRPVGTGFVNGRSERVDIEETFVFPLLKSSDVGNSRVTDCRRRLIVTQRFVGEETRQIKSKAPKTWEYLQQHADLLNARRSSIYRGKPRFSIFGVGPYTFAPWKVAISGFYKGLNFCLIGPIKDKPVVFDDTVNFLSFESKAEAEFVHRLLVSEPARNFYHANIFWDEKRPITTEVLRRLSLKALAEQLGQLDEYLSYVAKRRPRQDAQLTLGFVE